MSGAIARDGICYECWQTSGSKNCAGNGKTGADIFDDGSFYDDCCDAHVCPRREACGRRRLSDPSSETCVRCTDKATDHMNDRGLTCATFSWGIDNKCQASDREWITKGYCQQSCFDAGRGYADCCLPPPSPSAPPAPPPSAIPNMTAAVSHGADGILSGATNGIQVNRTSPSSARRGLSDPSSEACVQCPRRPNTDRPSCFMKRASVTCADYTYGIDGYCAGSQHREDDQWFDDAHCQQTCFDRSDESHSANCCRPPPPSPPPPSPCVMCDDRAPRSIGRAGGETCGDWRSVRGVELLLDKACSKEKWLRVEGYCRQSCSDAGCGYTNCCPPPPSPSPPSSPSSPAPPPSIAAAEFADAENVRIVGAQNGLTINSPRNTTCIVDGIKTVVEGACSSSGRRLAPVSTLASLCDTAPVLPAGSVTRRGLMQVRDYVVLEPGDILNLSAIPEDVQEVRLVGGGEKPFETEGSWELPAGRTLRITAIRDAGDTRVKINVTGELAKVSGTLRLSGLDIFREPFDDGCGGCEAGFPPVLDILEGGTVEIVETELRVVVGELAIAVKGSLVLREAIIAGATFDKLNEFASDTLPVTAMVLLGSLGALFITGVEHGMRHHHCSHPEVFFEDRCQ